MRFHLQAALGAAVALAAASPAFAQNIHTHPAPDAQAVRLTSPVEIDGKLDEEVWRTAPVAAGFRQSQPHEGEPATQRTEVRFAYDDAALYIGARMYDDSGAAGVRTRLVRRDDDVQSDYLQLIFDTYHDHIGRLFFLVNPSGVKNDANGLGGGGDASWDPVWEVATRIDSLGWTAEIRIPFSQLRYPHTSGEQTWGLQMWRQENRVNELSQWSFWKLNESGGPSQFGHLHGLVIASAPERAELLPYTVARSSNAPVSDPTDPFEHAHAADGRVGADATVLLTSNMTLNATVNPDFGQVEVDPAVVNLSAFETFFEEHRPFFVEGGSYFGFGGLNCFFCSNTSSLSLFYSRRIGRAPEVPDAVSNAGAVHAHIPDNTAILGAAKITGHTQSGWSIGLLDATTRREQADVQFADSARGLVTVEPAANYFVGRLAKDLRGGATQIRFMATSVARNLENPYLRDRLNSHSESFGLSTDSYFRNHSYHLMAQFAGTQVTADSTAMLIQQLSSRRYFQRPDRHPGHNGFLTGALDSSLTVMRGLGFFGRIAKETGNWEWELGENVRTPGFENNDIAALSRVDFAMTYANAMRMWTHPTAWYRQLMLVAGGQQQHNFDGDLTGRQGQVSGYWQGLNYWQVNTFWIHRPQYLDDKLARGGPVLGQPSGNSWNVNVSSDSRREVVLGVFAYENDNAYGDVSYGYGGSVQLKPRSNVSLSFGPSIDHSRDSRQYITTVAAPSLTAFYGSRYLFAHLVQHALSMETRLNVTFSPTLTLDLYAQPLIASGAYDSFREFAAPRSTVLRVYGKDFGSVSRTPQAGGPDLITLHPTTPTAGDSITFNAPDFTFRSLRGNAVLRWEYHPGSTLFLVWTRSAASSLFRGDINFGTDAADLLRAPSENIFLLKASYRLGL